jgi:hypothetical protein
VIATIRGKHRHISCLYCGFPNVNYDKFFCGSIEYPTTGISYLASKTIITVIKQANNQRKKIPPHTQEQLQGTMYIFYTQHMKGYLDTAGSALEPRLDTPRSQIFIGILLYTMLCVVKDLGTRMGLHGFISFGLVSVSKSYAACMQYGQK